MLIEVRNDRALGVCLGCYSGDVPGALFSEVVPASSAAGMQQLTVSEQDGNEII